MRKLKKVKVSTGELVICLSCITVCLICMLILLEMMFPSKSEKTVSEVYETPKNELVKVDTEPTVIQKALYVPAEYTYTVLDDITPPEALNIDVPKEVYRAALNDVIDGMIEISKGNLSREEALNIYTKMIEAEQKYNVSHRILLSMCAQESNFINYRDSKAGSVYGRGPMMISDITRTDFYYKTGKKYTVNDCYNWDKALEMACWIYNYNHTGYGIEDDEKALIIAYNVGQKYYKNNKQYLLKSSYASGKPYRHYDRVVEKMAILGYRAI